MRKTILPGAVRAAAITGIDIQTGHFAACRGGAKPF